MATFKSHDLPHRTVLYEVKYRIEGRGLVERHHVVGLAWWLINRWPSRMAMHHALRYNWLLRDANAPLIGTSHLPTHCRGALPAHEMAWANRHKGALSAFI